MRNEMRATPAANAADAARGLPASVVLAVTRASANGDRVCVSERVTGKASRDARAGSRSRWNGRRLADQRGDGVCRLPCRAGDVEQPLSRVRPEVKRNDLDGLGSDIERRLRLEGEAGRAADIGRVQRRGHEVATLAE